MPNESASPLLVMTAPAALGVPDFPPPSPSSVGRVAALLGGALLVLVALAVSFGTAVFALVGLAVAARVRRGPYTPFAGWLGASLVTAAAFAVAMGWGATRLPGLSSPEIRRAMAEAQARQAAAPPSAADRVLEQMYPGHIARTRAMQRAGAPVAASGAFLVWSMAMAVVFTAALFGGVVGTLGWGSATVLLYGMLGRWPGSHAQLTDPDPDALAVRWPAAEPASRRHGRFGRYMVRGAPKSTARVVPLW